MAIHVQWNKRVVLGILCIWINLSILGCTIELFSTPPPSQPQPVQMPQQQQPQQQQPQPQQPQQPQPQRQPAFSVVGIWESQIMTDYGVMYTQMVLQHDGSYSYQVVLGEYMTWEVGLYEVGQDFIHFSVQDYGPREYKGTEMSRPTSWTVFYTVVDENTMTWEDRVLGQRWTVYRRGP